MSNFSVTCRMLSQYLKEKRSSFGGLGLEMAPRTSLTDRQQTEVTFRTPAKTMSLFPGADMSREEDNAGDVVDADLSAPEAMNLFPQHAGFDSPAAFAEKESGAAAPEIKDPDTTTAQLTIFYSGKVLVWDDFPADKARDLMQTAIKENAAAALGHGDCAPTPAPPPASASDMPIARRNSLHRFLEKRKDRIITKAPYQIHGGSSNVAKPELSKFW